MDPESSSSCLQKQVTILNQINPVNTYLSYLFHTHVNIMPPSTPAV